MSARTGKIVVTGAAGFIGSAFLWRLNKEGIDRIIAVDEPVGPDKWRNLNGKKFVDLLDKDVFLKLITERKLGTEVEAIVHLGACSSTTESNVEYLTRNNYLYSRSLAEYSIQEGIRYIYASSAATYGDGSKGYSDDDVASKALEPLNHYGRSKHQFDLWLLNNSLQKKIAGLKFFNVYGPNEYHKGEMRSVVHKAYKQIKETEQVKLFKSYRSEYGDGEQCRDFVYVKDCADVMWWLLENQGVNGIFNVGSGAARTWNDLAGAVFKALKIQARIIYIDMPPDIRAHYQYFTEARLERLRTAGYSTPFTSLEAGVAEYVRDFLERQEACL